MYSILEKKRGMQGKILFSVFVGLMALLVLFPSSFARADSLSYAIGKNSTDIYCNGTVTVSFSPKGSEFDVIHVAAYKPGNPSGIAGDEGSFFVGNKPGSVTFKLYGYHYFRVTGDNGVTGTFTVTW